MTEIEIKALIVAGFEQVSRQHRIIARLPPGQTGLEACKLAGCRFAFEYEGTAASFFRRVYADGDLARTLDEKDMVLFRRLGGRTA